ncbi:peptidyl-dipeptidase Dcp . Metallo peptidase. MEROPS family M03A [Geodermatophilus obscurus]|uniref:Peptidyl-dipeptidase Dcp. Metallo peptidase. MEROPS family M03A n=1 Tax=Geodermatophilus obscurus TaxID=1861 RepID=A0A1I5DJM7_9ACTN|nr:M3 family metallopeptidase [Geodermatophilus obscurus]SFN99432.1 peptidyl-dipeptidase Dcp . Metallo peptidase. MEROPS family M03A [Geodermatophilus obscurus]
MSADATTAPSNPLLTDSPLPYRLPPFADITLEHCREAVLAGMAEQRAELDAITGSTAPPTFENTIEALERSGALLRRAEAVFGNLSSSLSTPRLREIERELAPLESAHADALRLDPALFARVDAVHAARRDSGLDAEAVRLVERHHLDRVLAGARLDDAGRARLSELNRELSELSTRFGQNLQLATEAAAVRVDDAAQLDGLTEEEVAAASRAAADRGLEGYVLPLLLPTGQPVLAALRNRELRRRVFEASVTRASSGEHDNGPVAARIARVRAERARLLGFATHADLVLADQTAGSTAAVDAMLASMVGPSTANARAEAEVLAEAAARDGVPDLAPWDWAFYSERVRAERYSVDTAALRPWFELDRVLVDGVFRAAELLYGYTFTARPDLAGYHPDVRVWEVSGPGGEQVGLYLGDFLAREGKRGGAWMSSFVTQSRLLGTRPVVVNNLNVTPAPEGRPTLLTLSEVDTLFHEFGHALHGLSSAVTYPRFAGTAVPRDFVEFPSQVNEMWAMEPQVLAHYARHVETGEPLPGAVVEAIDAARLWGEGFATLEYLAATLLDQAWHRITPETEVGDPAEFERWALEEAGVASDLVPPRYRTTYFQHVFAGGYAAGYYSYIWSEVLDADTVEWFRENGGLRRENGDVFRERLLSRGGSVDPLEAFRAVRGRDADPGPLLRRRGLTPVGPPTIR